MSKTHHVVVIGAGSSGLSVAMSLRDRGRPALVIEKTGNVAASWRSRYEALKLNTGRPFSHLPGRPYPRGTPLYPTRDDVIDDLERHAHEDGIDLLLDTAVTRIDRNHGQWRLTTSNGDIDAAQVVVATGYLHAVGDVDVRRGGYLADEIVGHAVGQRLRTHQDRDVLGPLGKGGMGVVYQARQPELDQLVVLNTSYKERKKLGIAWVNSCQPGRSCAPAWHRAAGTSRMFPGSFRLARPASRAAAISYEARSLRGTSPERPLL